MAKETNGTASSVPHIDVTPQDIISRAKIRLETLVRLYYLRHSFESCDTFMVYFLMLLGNLTLEDLATDAKTKDSALADPQAFRSTLILCAVGLNSQGQSYHLGNLVYRAFLDRMKPDDMDLVKAFTPSQDVDDDQLLMAQDIRSQWPIPIIKINEDPKTANLETLVKEYERPSLEPSDSSWESTPTPT